MKVFVIKKGTPVTLTNDQGETKQVTAKCDTDWMDFVTDPIYEWNNFKRVIDYFKFYLDAKQLSPENKKFKYAIVNAKYVETLC
jgi:hypothetical protein